MERVTLDKLKLTRGTVLRVHWCDIVDSVTGDTTKAALASRITYGVFWEVKPCPETGLECLVTTTTEDTEGPEDQGYTIYPLAVVLRLDVVHRPRKRKKEPENV